MAPVLTEADRRLLRALLSGPAIGMTPGAVALVVEETEASVRRRAGRLRRQGLVAGWERLSLTDQGTRLVRR